MSTISAGILLFQRKPHLQVLLGHPGGPYWQNKDEGAWSVPKGEVKEGETMIDAAKREFNEELGFIPEGDYLELGFVKQKGGKTVYAWAVECMIPDDFIFEPDFFEMEWPPKSGHVQSFPEIDKIEYFPAFEAKKKINPAQQAFINRLIDLCSKTY